ncbi:hypothetical protein [Joostella sp. CR20]|uniref:hypothetical protein n=1 Tax=Joostella sp. CR20 TaxID=2804312 RepID=UPI00313EEFE7
MKHLLPITIFISTLLFNTCEKKLSTEEKIKSIIEAEVLKTLSDPKSYEFIEMGAIDTIYKKEYYKELADEYDNLMSGLTDAPEKKSTELQAVYDSVVSNKNKYEALSQQSEANEIHEITTTFKYRANDTSGEKIITIYDVALSENLTVKQLQYSR